MAQSRQAADTMLRQTAALSAQDVANAAADATTRDQVRAEWKRAGQYGLMDHLINPRGDDPDTFQELRDYLTERANELPPAREPRPARPSRPPRQGRRPAPDAGAVAAQVPARAPAAAGDGGSLFDDDPGWEQR